MKSFRIKIIDEVMGYDKVDDKVNKFLIENQEKIKVVDIKFCVENNIRYVMIVYLDEVNKEERDSDK